MPSNISVEYALAQKKLYAAKTPEEKLSALIEMKSHAPAHKGAENLRSDINKRISEMKSSIERQKTQSKKGAAPSMYVKKDGVGQVLLVGFPNAGRSSLLNKLAGKEIAEVTDYPFATKEPVPAMMNYDGGMVQIVELPAIVQGSAEGKSQGKEIMGMIRNADALVLVCSKEEAPLLVEELKKAFIFVNRTRPPIEVKHSEFVGIQISGKEFLKFPVGQLEDYLKSSGYSNSSVIITGNINSISEVSEALNERITYKPAIAINPREATEHSLIDFKDRLFLLLGRVLVYTKKPGQDADMSSPLSLDKGATVYDLAKILHKDFASKLKYARVWGSAKFPGQRVGPEYVLKNKDIVEISI